MHENTSTEIRHVKAWQIWPEWMEPAIEPGHIVYNTTASKARYQYYQSSDVEMNWLELKVLRAKQHDKYLPARHWLADHLTKEQRQIVCHSYGVGHREYFCTCPGDSELARLTFEFGLFTGPHYEWSYFEKAWNFDGPSYAECYFYLTWLGKQVARSLLPADPWRLHEYRDCCFERF